MNSHIKPHLTAWIVTQGRYMIENCKSTANTEGNVLKIAKRVILLMPAAAVLLPLAAHAADPGFCRGYAAAAIRQVRGALNHPRCLPGLQGARWSADFNVHYNWCLGASYAQTGSERDARTNFLRGCAM